MGSDRNTGSNLDYGYSIRGYKMESIEKSMQQIKKYCEDHPTCKECKKNKKHIGCEFRGKSPREWNIESEGANEQEK